ncbi:GNAT family N-acetyltransferase [Leclercia sp. EC_58]|uniref:GNAT family N-acetyltransferase n=1 Tax=Leclercia sp. EC_58 TaxID=2584090 RepID=UPI001C709C40|nr:GNAT family N-acetyltransferase [Leclercia sp. EC_58]MBW9401930.1 GNAT family N-acetyltransferase [Leclercia sp. EC_58]
MNSNSMVPKIMQAEKIVGKTITLRNVTPNDAEFIVHLRTDPMKSRFISSTSDDIEKQREWLNSYLESSGQAYFIIEGHNEVKYGTVRMYEQIGDSFCWGSWVISKDSPSHYAVESSLLLYTYALHLGFEKSHFDVRKGNSSVIKFHERFGAKRKGETELDILFEITKDAIESSIKKFSKHLPDHVQIIV